MLKYDNREGYSRRLTQAHKEARQSRTAQRMVVKPSRSETTGPRSIPPGMDTTNLSRIQLANGPLRCCVIEDDR
jgi:hypothetical protein